MKIGILLFGISILLWNCKKEEKLVKDETGIPELLQLNFNSKDFKKTIPYEYVVDWTNPQKHYSEELKLSYYEFPINYLTPLNPNTLNKQKGAGNYYIKFKIIATENNDNEYSYYAVKFYQDVDLLDNELINSKVNFNDTKNFTGTINLFDKEGDLGFAKKLKNGCLKEGKVYYYNEFASSLKTVSNDCYTITVHHYTDWYKYYPDLGIYIFDGVSYDGSTSETFCEDSGGAYPDLPEDYLEVAVGSGTYTDTSNDTTLVEIDELVELPCPGDPIINVELAPQLGSSGISGGMFGCTRYGGTDCTSADGRNKKHRGIDLKNPYGSPIYAMYDGTIYSAKHDPEGGGYFTRIQSTVNGEVILTEYHHLQEGNRVEENTDGTLRYVSAGDIIGYQGESGNLKDAIARGDCESHLHIGVLLHDGTNAWSFDNYDFVNARDYLNTYIRDDGITLLNDCNN